METNPSLSTPYQQQDNDGESEKASEVLSRKKTDEASEILPFPGNNQSTSEQQIASEPPSTASKCTFIRQKRYLSLVRNPFNCKNFQLGNIAGATLLT